MRAEGQRGDDVLQTGTLRCLFHEEGLAKRGVSATDSEEEEVKGELRHQVARTVHRFPHLLTAQGVPLGTAHGGDKVRNRGRQGAGREWTVSVGTVSVETVSVGTVSDGTVSFRQPDFDGKHGRAPGHIVSFLYERVVCVRNRDPRRTATPAGELRL